MSEGLGPSPEEMGIDPEVENKEPNSVEFLAAVRTEFAYLFDEETMNSVEVEFLHAKTDLEVGEACSYLTTVALEFGIEPEQVDELLRKHNLLQ